jgi:hypothetical protein
MSTRLNENWDKYLEDKVNKVRASCCKFFRRTQTVRASERELYYLKYP